MALGVEGRKVSLFVRSEVLTRAAYKLNAWKEARKLINFRRAHKAIHLINVHRIDSAESFVDTYSLESDLTVGYRHLPFEHLWSGDHV